MASVGALSARASVLCGHQRFTSSDCKTTARRKVSTVVRAAEPHRPGVNMPEGPKDALNKWSRKITQPKSQGASQVRDIFIHRVLKGDRESLSEAEETWFSTSMLSPRTYRTTTTVHLSIGVEKPSG